MQFSLSHQPGWGLGDEETGNFVKDGTGEIVVT